MKVHKAAENYLEAILVLSRKNGQVRAIDIAKDMNYSKPTISVAMKQLRKDGLIKTDDDGFIILTEKGLEIANRIFERHNVIAEMLMALGVDEKTAYEDSCKIEHEISSKSFECIKAHYLKNKKSPITK